MPAPRAPQFAAFSAPPGVAGSLGTTTSSPSPTAPGSTGPGSFTPDWASLIANDAGLKAAQAALAGSASADKSALGSEITNAYETFGKPIDLASLASQLGMSQADIQAALGPDAQRIAQENTDAGTSTTARLDQANTKGTRALVANLNKRGLLHSGEAGYQFDQQNLGYRQAQQDAYSKFLGYLQQYQQGYLAAQQQRAASLAASLNSAADRQYSLNQPAPQSPPPAPRAADGFQPYGGFGFGPDYNPGPNDQIPNQPRGVTNSNLADLLFGGTLGYSRP